MAGKRLVEVDPKRSFAGSNPAGDSGPSSLEAVITDSDAVVALIVRGAWTCFLLFVRGCIHEAFAALRHHDQLVEYAGQRVLRIGLEIAIIGDVAIRSCKGRTHIGFPLATVDATRAPENTWQHHPTIDYGFFEDELVIEPRETDRHWRDVMLPAGIAVMQLHSEVSCGPNIDDELRSDETSVVGC